MTVAVCLLFAFGSWGILAAETARRRYQVQFRHGWYAPAFTVAVLWLLTIARLVVGVRTLAETALLDGICLPLLSACAFALCRSCLAEARREG